MPLTLEVKNGEAVWIDKSRYKMVLSDRHKDVLVSLDGPPVAFSILKGFNRKRFLIERGHHPDKVKENCHEL